MGPWSRCARSSPPRKSPILDSMEKVKVAGMLYRLVRQQAKKSPRVVAVALIAPDTWGVRAEFDDGQRDYRYPVGGPLEEMPGGFDCWPPAPGETEGEPATVHEIRRRAAKE